jgi:hypothetical protein
MHEPESLARTLFVVEKNHRGIDSNQERHLAAIAAPIRWLEWR